MNITFPEIDMRNTDFLILMKLKKVVIGNSIYYIEKYAFSNCPNLEKVTVGNYVACIG